MLLDQTGTMICLKNILNQISEVLILRMLIQIPLFLHIYIMIGQMIGNLIIIQLKTESTHNLTLEELIHRMHTLILHSHRIFTTIGPMTGNLIITLHKEENIHNQIYLQLIFLEGLTYMAGQSKSHFIQKLKNHQRELKLNIMENYTNQFLMQARMQALLQKLFVIGERLVGQKIKFLKKIQRQII